MAKTASERQKDYRNRRSMAGENGERRINTWVTTAAALALKRLAARWGSKPKPQKFPSSQIKVSHERVQVDHLAIALEGVMPVEQDVPPSCR